VKKKERGDWMRKKMKRRSRKTMKELEIAKKKKKMMMTQRANEKEVVVAAVWMSFLPESSLIEGIESLQSQEISGQPSSCSFF